MLDLNRLFLASLYDVQIHLLQLHLALQNDPDVVKSRQLHLREKIEAYGEDFPKLLDDHRVGTYRRKLKRDLAEAGSPRLARALRLPSQFRLPQNLLGPFGGDLATKGA